MESQMLCKENSQNVNVLLSEIKKYLQKLESGQMEIEASQWELHKDITNVRFSIQEMQKLKEDVEEMKLSNAEVMGVIKTLEKKFASYEAKLAKNPSDISEGLELEEKAYAVSEDEKTNSKDCKRSDTYKALSEVIETPSNIKQNSSEKKRRDFVIEDFVESEREEAKCYKKKSPKKYTEPKVKSRRNQRARKPDGVIMARYLKDSAKYHKRRSQSTKKNPSHNDSFYTTTTRPEPKHGMYWDDLQQKDSAFPSTTGNSLSMRSFKGSKDQKSTSPRQFRCPKCLKSFSYKCEYIRHQIHEHPMSEKKFYCSICRKFIVKQCKTNKRCCARIARTKKKSGAPPYTCSYCGKVTSSPEQLTAHIRKCRIISRTNLSEHN